MRRGIIAGAVGAGLLVGASLFLPTPATERASSAAQLDAKTLDAIGKIIDANGAARWPSFSGDPFTCDATTAGAFYYDTSANQFKGCDASTWGQIGGGSGSAGEFAKKSGDQTGITSTSLISVTDLSFSIAANATVYGLFTGTYTTSSTGEGIRFGVNCPASPTSVTLIHQLSTNAGGSVQAEGDASTCNSIILANGSGPGASPARYWVWFAIENGANAGTIQFQVAAENSGGTGTVNVLAESYGYMFTAP